MTYLPSLIIRPSSSYNSFDTFIEWYNQSNQANLNHESIQNQVNIVLINLVGESIKIETVRNIKEKLAYSNYIVNQPRYFVFLDAHLITIPAQNALLKSIEEPPKNTQIIFITKLPQKLLETIRSRCQLINLSINDQPIKTSSEIAKLYFEVISSNPGQKITLASRFKERDSALEICNQLIEFLHQELSNSKTNLSTKQIVQNCDILLKTLDYLEHNTNVALTLENCFFDLID